MKHDAIRGNVATEIARRPFAGGCGCGYPDNVSDNVVNWSNRIIATLNATASQYATIQNELQRLPVSKRFLVADATVQVIHGDCRPLAGWSLSRDSLSSDNSSILADIEACNAQIIACTHTCEPIATTFKSSSKASIAVINNGSAGMPNFNHEPFGVITRIATTPSPHETLYGSVLNNAYIDAIAVRYDQSRFLEWFLEFWPPGSAAHQSYFGRLSRGIDQFNRRCQIRVLLTINKIPLFGSSLRHRRHPFIPYPHKFRFH